MNLQDKFYYAALDRCDGNRKSALEYLRSQSHFYAKKVDERIGTSTHSAWRKIVKAYRDAADSMDYVLMLDQGLWGGD